METETQLTNEWEEKRKQERGGEQRNGKKSFGGDLGQTGRPGIGGGTLCQF